ncbi:MAG: hypothetical protein ACR2MK_00760 [Solirubrobacteraceae bacterium]
MSSIRKHSRLVLVAACCVALGAGASAIASAGASTSATAGGSAHAAHHRGLRGRGLRRLAKRAVHGNLVVASKQGFVTVTFDRGKVDSVSGQQLTITEGTKRAAYKTVTLTIPAGARVRDDRQKATLSQLKPGQRVLVVQAPKRTLVVAHTPKHA